MLSFVFDVGLLYAIIAFIGGILVSIILNRTLATQYKETVDRPFCVLLIFFVLFCFVDGTWGLFFSRTFFTSATGYRIMTYGFHYMAAFSAFVWAGYMMHYQRLRPVTRRGGNCIRLVLLAVQMYILTSNIWTAKAFVVDDQAVYTPGPFRTVLFWVQFAYYAIIAMTVFVLLFVRRDPASRKNCRTAMVFSAIPLIAGIAQLIFPDAPMYSIGFMVSAVTIYSFNITRQREEYMTRSLTAENGKLSAIVSGLSNDYSALYYVDMKTGNYEMFGSLNPEGNGTRKSTGKGDDFFADCVKNVPIGVVEEDCARVIDNLSHDFILGELSAKRSFNFNYRMKVGDGVRFYMTKVISSEIDGETNKIIVGVFDDEERMRNEMKQQEQLRQAREDAEAASRAKSAFLFSMSHDVRTPLNAILGFTGMARKNLSDPERANECLEKVDNAGNHLLSIINDILDMSRIEYDKVVISEQPMSLKKCGLDLIDMVRPSASEHNIELIPQEGDIPEHEWIWGDEMHLSRILLNILTNAVKYTRPGGRIYHAVYEKPSEREGYSVFEIVVSDTGIGMSPEFLEHVFDTFAREQNSTTSGIQGTGLGMAITKSLVELMNGEIKVESEKNVGTTVRVTIPFRLAEAPETAGEAAVERNAGILKGKRVLLVEDNELNREIACDILAEYDMVIEEAEDGTVALDKCRKLLELGPGERDGKKYDLILMDVQMPVMDGYTATRAIRALADDYFARVPIIAMTANVFAEDVKKSQEAGMNAHLGKPINVAELEQLLAGYLK